MSVAARIVARNHLFSTIKWSVMAPQMGMATMKVFSPEEHKISKEDFWKKNERLTRPLSPHLSIYKMQMTSVLSITHRMTGVVQTGIITLFALGAVATSKTYPELLSMVSQLGIASPLLFGAKFVLVWPTAYHALNGIRHLSWDLGYGFRIPDLHKTGWTVVGGSLLVSAALASL